MTRINIVPPAELMDQHLVAEYRETRLLVANLRRSFNSKSGLSKKNIPVEFTLNRGHVLFFKDKGRYIKNRYDLLRQEMKARGFTPQFDTIDITCWPKGFYNDWQPTERDMAIVRERIALRISSRPKWYRYYGKLLEN